MSYHYSFEEVNESDYTLTFTYNTDAKLIGHLFKKSKKKLAKKLNKDIDADLENIQEFEIPDNQKKIMFPYLMKVIKNHIKHVGKEIEPDGFKIITSNITGAVYQLLKDKSWKVYITVEGQYDRREMQS